MKKTQLVKASCIVSLIAIMAIVTVAMPPAPPIHGQFQAFGNARLVVGGIPPDNNAVDLTSNCGNEPYNPTCYNDATFNFSGIAFVVNDPPPPSFPTINALTNLSTDYNFGGADCGGGAPRFVISLSGGSGNDNLTGDFGQPPNFTNCYYGWLNTGNFTTDSTKRWQFDLNNVNLSWAQVQALYGSRMFTEVDIVVDGGWITPRGQDVTIDNFTINNTVMHAQDAFHH
jgi:hypothetical protein